MSFYEAAPVYPTGFLDDIDYTSYNVTEILCEKNHAYSVGKVIAHLRYELLIGTKLPLKNSGFEDLDDDEIEQLKKLITSLKYKNRMKPLRKPVKRIKKELETDKSYTREREPKVSGQTEFKIKVQPLDGGGKLFDKPDKLELLRLAKRKR